MFSSNLIIEYMLSLEHEKEECYSGALASWHLKKWALAEPFDIQVKYTNTITIFTGFRPRHSAVLAERIFFFLCNYHLLSEGTFLAIFSFRLENLAVLGSIFCVLALKKWALTAIWFTYM